MKNVANIITSIRIIGVFLLLYTKSSSVVFYIIYTLCGVSDAIDGWVARKTKTTSEFGAKLDSLADILFYFTMLVKLLPILINQLPSFIWCLTAGIIGIRILGYVVAYMKYHKFASLHTYMNKITGLMVFLIPYIVKSEGINSFSIFVCLVAFVAALEELMVHICSRECHPNEKSLFDFIEVYRYAK